jgi:hypothetical protein
MSYLLLLFDCKDVVADAFSIGRRVQDFLWRIGEDLDPMIDITTMDRTLSLTRSRELNSQFQPGAPPWRTLLNRMGCQGLGRAGQDDPTNAEYF